MANGTLSPRYFENGLNVLILVFSQAWVAIVLVLCQALISNHRVLSAYFRPVNEFLCSMAWVIWTLEGALVYHNWSYSLGMFILTLRLLLAPLIFKGALANPCAVLYRYLTSNGSAPKLYKITRVRTLLTYVALELLSIPCGLVICTLFWGLLGNTISADHHKLLQNITPGYNLRTSMESGFLCELFVTFVTFLPGILIRQSPTLTALDLTLVMYLIFKFGSVTGAFMNPLSAFVPFLMWHSNLGTSDYLIHAIVFWVGPVVGTILAVAIARVRVEGFKINHR